MFSVHILEKAKINGGVSNISGPSGVALKSCQPLTEVSLAAISLLSTSSNEMVTPFRLQCFYNLPIPFLWNLKLVQHSTLMCVIGERVCV